MERAYDAERDPTVLTEADVRAAYRWILGREPESEAVVTSQLSAGTSAILRERFLGSSEFKASSGLPLIGRHLLATTPVIEVVASDDTFQTLLDRSRKTWAALGTSEPHWSVLTADLFLSENIEANIEEFYLSGQREIEQVHYLLRRNGLDFPKNGLCIDFGCGVGRLSLALADYCGRVLGIDISEPHRALAEQAAQSREVSNATFRKIEQVSDIETLPRADFILSLIVIQHNPPPVMAAILDGLLDRLAPGGAAVFQIPTFKTDYEFRIDPYLDYPASERMEMHVLPQAVIHAAIARHGCRLKEMREDTCSFDKDILSHTFLVQKQVG